MADPRVYIVESDFGINGRAALETELDGADRESAVAALMAGDYHGRPTRVFAFDPDIADVSADMAGELVRRAWWSGVDLPDAIRDFCGEHITNLPPLIDQTKEMS